MHVGNVSMSEGPSILRKLLEKRNRKLTQAQSDFVDDCIAIEPTVLFVQLALRAMMSWTSFYPVSGSAMVGGVRGENP